MSWGFWRLISFEANIVSFCLLVVLRRKRFDEINILCVWVCFEFGFQIGILMRTYVFPVIDEYFYFTWSSHTFSRICIVNSCHKFVKLPKRSTLINIKNWTIKVTFYPSYLIIYRFFRLLCKLWTFNIVQLYYCFCSKKFKLSFKYYNLRFTWATF